MGKHYVPQHYLRAFADREHPTQVWMFDKREHSWSLAAIKRVAQERDYYGPDDERRLTTEIENPGNAVLDALRAGVALSATDRPSLARYMAVMMMRVPRKRRFSRSLIPGAIRKATARARESIEALIDPGDPARQRLRAEVDRVQAKFEREPPAEVEANVVNPWATADMLDAVSRMTWRVVAAPAGSFGFITSDNPAYYFAAYGVGSAESELVFPIAPTLALLGSHQGEPARTLALVAKPPLLKEANRRIAAGAERFVFSHRRAPWIETLATRRNPYLSRILWEGPS